MTGISSPIVERGMTGVGFYLIAVPVAICLLKLLATETMLNCSFEPLETQVMFARASVIRRYFSLSTGLTLVDLFNPSVLEQHAGVARAGRNLNSHR